MSEEREPAREEQGIFGRRWKLFNLAGFNVHIDVSWLIVGILFYWTLAAFYFPTSYPEISTGQAHLMALIGTVGFVLSIVIHEFCHAAVARRFGLPMKGITLFVFGGVAEMRQEPSRPAVEFWMAIAGPVASLVLALVLYLVTQGLGRIDAPILLFGICNYLWRLNLVLAIFNLIPAFPLDGGRILRSALWAKRKDLAWATRVASSVGSGFGFLLMMLGVLAFFTGNPVGGLWYFFIGMFLRTIARASYGQIALKETLRGKKIRDLGLRTPVTVSRTTSIDDFVENVVSHYWHRTYPVTDAEGRFVGLLSTKDLRDLPREKWPFTRVVDRMRQDVGEREIKADDPAETLLTRFLQMPDADLFVATEGGLPIGVIAPSDLARYLRVGEDLVPPALGRIDKEAG